MLIIDYIFDGGGYLIILIGVVVLGVLIHEMGASGRRNKVLQQLQQEYRGKELPKMLVLEEGKIVLDEQGWLCLPKGILPKRLAVIQAS